MVLTEALEKVQNRGLIVQSYLKKIDITQVFVDLKHFERSVLRKEFQHGKYDQDSYEKPLFSTQKTNLPKNHSTPELLVYLK